MTTLPNGPYHLYIDAKLPPLVVQVFYDYVYEAGEPNMRPLSSYRGKFIRLVEQPDPDEPAHGFFAGTGSLAYVPVATEPDDARAAFYRELERRRLGPDATESNDAA